MILACQNICKAFGSKELIKNASFHIEDREKAAIVGINGVGKSTLLKIIIKETDADSGEVIIAKGKTVGYLAQHQELSGENTIFDELFQVRQELLSMERRMRILEQEMKYATGDSLEEKMKSYANISHDFELQNGYAYKSEVIGILKGLGFEESEFDKRITTLSGGQKTRVSLGKLLLTKPDIILLDEPTNHLDLNSIAWLETYLMNYQGAVIIVAHDRYFLNKVVTKVIEIDQGEVHTFLGNYSDYAGKKAKLREIRLKEYLNQQREIRHHEEVIQKLKSFNREKSIKRAESREKMLAKIDVIEKPTEANSEMRFSIEPKVMSGNDVLKIEGLSKSFGNLHLFSDLNFDIKRGERVAIIGNNGTGKTTILKIINRVLDPDTGKITLGSKVSIGYYDQEHHVLHMEKTIFDEISDDYPYLTNTEIRNVLAAFLFTNDDVFKRISDLSGGERGRVSLAKLMLSNANFLILDEPTNHLDIQSKEILEQALNSYTGTVLYVSHDRYFINTTATRILDLTGETLVNYIGNYDYYLEKKDELTAIYAPKTVMTSPSSVKTDTKIKSDWKAQKAAQSQERKRRNDLKKVEERIAELEERDKEIDKEMEIPEVFTNISKCQALSEEKDTLLQELSKLYEQWEILAE